MVCNGSLPRGRPAPTAMYTSIPPSRQTHADSRCRAAHSTIASPTPIQNDHVMGARSPPCCKGLKGQQNWVGCAIGRVWEEAGVNKTHALKMASSSLHISST
jgi:hypothetical protein